MGLSFEKVILKFPFVKVGSLGGADVQEKFSNHVLEFGKSLKRGWILKLSF